MASRSLVGRRGRRTRLLITILLILPVGSGLLVGFAPLILSRTVVAHFLLDRATATLRLQIRCGSVSLGWLEPPEISDIRVYDSGQDVLLELRRLSFDRPLWHLLRAPSDWGQIELQQPVLYVRCRPGGSNLEDLCHRMPRGSDSSTAWQGDIAVRDGTLTLSDPAHDLRWTLTDWQADLRLSTAGKAPLSFETSMTVDHGTELSTLAARGQLTAAEETQDSVGADVQLQLQQFPAAVTRLLATRLDYDLAVEGQLDGQLEGRWQPAKAGGHGQLAGEFTADGLSVRSPDWHDDRVDLQHAVLTLNVQSQGNTLHVHQLELASDLGDLMVDGQFDWRNLTLFSSGTADLPTQPCRFSGTIDLASLARVAPRLLHMRDDTRLTAGQVQWDLGCRTAGDRPCWEGTVEASQLHAEQEGRAIGIDQPVRLSFRLTQTPEGIRVDELVGQSTFLALRGQAEAVGGQVAWRADLSRLHNELGQLINWGGIRLAGDCEGHLGWQTTPAGELRTTGRMTGRDLQVVYGPHVNLQEPELRLDLAARGRLQQRRLNELTSAQLQLRSGDDQLSVHLTERVANPLVSRRWPLQLRCSGQLASWRQRLMGLIPSDLPQLNGQIDAESQLLVDPALIQFASARVTLQHLELLAADRKAIWSEPLVRARAGGRYAPPQGQIDVDSLEVKTSATELQATGTIRDLTGEIDVRLAGQLGYDLQRWSARMRPVWGDELQLIGRVTRPFTVEGPCRQIGASPIRPVSTAGSPSPCWIPEGLTARLGLGWESVHAWGFDLEAGSLEAQLQRQRISVEPVSLPVSGGQLHLAPQIRLRGNPVLETGPGPVIERVQITPAMCHGWLKYVAPLIANATQAEGLFSVELDNARLPLNRPAASSITGTLSVHSARVGPGPLARQLLNLVGQIRSIVQPGRAASGGLDPAGAWVLLPEQRVPFRLERGRVWHEGLTMLVGDLPVQTHGWVALNQRLSLTAEIPVQEKWLGNNRWLSGLKDQKLSIPLHGTLQQPQLDRRVLDNLSRRTLTGVAEGLIQQELQQQLDRLLPKR